VHSGGEDGEGRFAHPPPDVSVLAWLAESRCRQKRYANTATRLAVAGALVRAWAAMGERGAGGTQERASLPTRPPPPTLIGEEVLGEEGAEFAGLFGEGVVGLFVGVGAGGEA